MPWGIWRASKIEPSIHQLWFQKFDFRAQAHYPTNVVPNRAEMMLQRRPNGRLFIGSNLKITYEEPSMKEERLLIIRVVEILA